MKIITILLLTCLCAGAQNIDPRVVQKDNGAGRGTSATVADGTVMPGSRPATQFKLAQSPKGAAMTATYVPMVLPGPPQSQAIVVTTPGSNTAVLKLSTVLPMQSKWSTNFIHSLVLSNSWLNTFTNPNFYTQTLAWNPSTDPTVAGYNVYFGPSSRNYTNCMDAGGLTNFMVRGLVAGATYFYAATTYNSSGVQSPYSNEVSARPDQHVPPVSLFFDVTNTNGVRLLRSVRRL